MIDRIFGWDYPAGAEHDPRAPYNQVDPERITCPCCNGAGWLYTITNIRSGKTKEVTYEEYEATQTQEEAEASGKGYYQDTEEICPECDGEGEVYDEDEEDPDGLAADYAWDLHKDRMAEEYYNEHYK